MNNAAAGLMAQVYRRPIAALFLICFVAWLPGFFTLPALDRDESRFAQSSKQMLETGNFVDIQQGYEKRYKKPVGIYWMQAAATAAIDAVRGNTTHGDIWTYRVPSFLGAFAAVALTFWTASAIADVEVSFFAALLLGLSLLLTAESKIAKTDAVLLATIVGSMGVLLRLYLADPQATPPRPLPSLPLILAGWAAFGVGLLVKAPVNLLVLGITVLVLSTWDRRGRWLWETRPLLGLPIALLIFLPWLIAIAVISHGAFFASSLGHDFAGKVVGGEETHGAPPGYYLVAANISFWPTVLVLLPGFLFSIRHRAEPAVRFLLVWAAATWLMFEIAPTKLPHYVLPAYPALAILSALWLKEVQETETGLMRGFRLASITLFTLVGVAFAAFLLYAPMRFGDGPPAWLYAGAVVLVLLVLTSAVFALREQRQAAVGGAAIAAITLYYCAGFGTVPHLGRLWVTEAAVAAVARHAQPDDPPVIASGYQEASMTFRLGTKTHLANGSMAASLAAMQGGLALIEDHERDAFLGGLAEQNDQAVPVDQFSGFNYSRGRKVHITVYRVAPPYQMTAPPPE
ncbi:MAG TPA: glycosyltransferase family 39 protein [Rhizomicrobium sp.]|jgi:4-amino-4-deoxy-L-arabinose transferase-like glycosyltransferase